VVPVGVYRERFTVDKRVALVGRPGAVVDGGGQGTVVRIAAAGAELRGLVLRNSGDSYAREDAGIRIDKAADVRILDTRVEDTLFGIFAVQADRCRIEHSAVVGKDLPHERRGDGIRLWYSAGCVLRHNVVDRSRDVIVWYSADTVAEDNEVRNSRYGLHYMYSDHNRFRHNRFEDNQVGAAIMYSHDVELRENAFSFSNGVAAYGVLVKDADDIFIENNRLVGNATALFLDGAPQSRGRRVTVHGNLLARNDVGIALQPLSRGVEVWENAFVGNAADVQVQGSGTAEGNVWAVSGRGNYWSDAIVYDRDGDGVSELPYHLEDTYENLADRHPALAFFRGTPGAEAIDIASRLFPIFATRPKLTDPHPLVRPKLTAWTQGDDTRSHGHGLAALGLGLLAVTGVVLGAARRGVA
jgi:nitrous oxidase accessory protein